MNNIFYEAYYYMNHMSYFGRANTWRKVLGVVGIDEFNMNLKERCSARVLPRHICRTMVLIAGEGAGLRKTIG